MIPYAINAFQQFVPYVFSLPDDILILASKLYPPIA